MMGRAVRAMGRAVSILSRWRLLQPSEVGAVASLLVAVTVFAVLSDGRFLRAGNLASVLSIFAEQGFLVLGITLLMISGEIDISVGSTYGLVALLFVTVGRIAPTPVAFLVGLSCAAAVGLFNGYVRTRFNVPSLIITLGVLFSLRGIIYFITQGFPRSLAPDGFTHILAGKVVGDYRISLLWLLVAGLLFYMVLHHTRYGNRLFSVGNNRELARMMGVRVERVLLANFMICSMMAGLSGMISVARMRTVAAAHGEGFELIAIGASVIGGTLLTGGYGTVIGALVGALLLASIRSGLLLSGVPGFWYIAFVGFVLVLASIFNMAVVRRWLRR